MAVLNLSLRVAPFLASVLFLSLGIAIIACLSDHLPYDGSMSTWRAREVSKITVHTCRSLFVGLACLNAKLVTCSCLRAMVYLLHLWRRAHLLPGSSL